MGIFNKVKAGLFGSAGDHTAEAQTYPAAAHFETQPDMVYSPVMGTVVSLEDVDDDIIASGVFGRGCAIIPLTGVLYAPFSGRVSATAVTNHMIGLTMGAGVEVLIHIGLGTVAMDGKGFTRLVEAGQDVEAGTPLISFDLNAIARAGFDDVVSCVVTNYSELAAVEHAYSSATTIEGHPVVKMGDPLLSIVRS